MQKKKKSWLRKKDLLVTQVKYEFREEKKIEREREKDDFDVDDKVKKLRIGNGKMRTAISEREPW